MAAKTITNRVSIFKRAVIKKLKEQGVYNDDDFEIGMRDMCNSYRQYLMIQEKAEEAMHIDEYELSMKLHRTALSYQKQYNDNLKNLGVTLKQRIDRDEAKSSDSSVQDALKDMLKGK